MGIRSVRIKRRAVVISYENEGETHDISSRDNPLPAFTKAVEALASLVLDVLHLPTEYQHGLKPTGLTVTGKQGTQLVTVIAQKELTDCNSPFNITTPLRFLSVPEEEGSYSPPLSTKQVALVDAVISEAKKYINGDRAQGQLPLEPDADGFEEETAEDAPEPAKGDVLDFAKDAPAKKGRKKKETVTA
jgi:hypothetical protein